MPMGPVDPSDSIARDAVALFLKETGSPAYSSYDIRRIDLDADGRRDALVLLKSPYGYWCGAHGCAMLVLKASNDSFTLVNAIQPIREPLYIGQAQTNGWKDLIVRVSGRWDKAKDVAMKFDGSTYPSNPSNLPPTIRMASSDDIRFFYD